MEITVQRLAELVHGRVEGDGSVVIRGARPLTDAGPGDITFLEDEKHVRHLAQRHVTAVLARKRVEGNGVVTIAVDDPLAAFVAAYQCFQPLPPAPPPQIDPTAVVHPSVELGREVSIHPFVHIGEGCVLGDRCRLYPGVVLGRNCRLGDDVTLYPHVVVYDGCRLGSRVVVHANSVIGSDGFGYRHVNGRHVKIPQLGSVEIEDDVEIGACVTIDRGTFQATRIGAGSKIDNQVQIAHNCRIGKHNVLASQVGIAGSTTTGDYVVCAGQVGIADHVHVGDGATIGAQAGVIGDVASGEKILGSPGRPAHEAKIWYLNTLKVPTLRKDVDRILKHLGLGKE